MEAALTSPESHVRDKASRIQALVQANRTVRELDLDGEGQGPEALDERRRRWYREIEDAVLDLSNSLPEGAEDYDARKLFEYLIELRRAVASEPEHREIEMELASAHMRDVLGRISRRLEHERLDDPQHAVSAIFKVLTGVSGRDLSRLLGVSEKTIGAWRVGGVVERNVPRVVLTAQLLTYLRASLTPQGLLMWFDAPRPQLGDRTPLDLLKDPAAAQEPLVALARGARAQLGS